MAEEGGGLKGAVSPLTAGEPDPGRAEELVQQLLQTSRDTWDRRLQPWAHSPLLAALKF